MAKYQIETESGVYEIETGGGEDTSSQAKEVGMNVAMGGPMGGAFGSQVRDIPGIAADAVNGLTAGQARMFDKRPM